KSPTFFGAQVTGVGSKAGTKTAVSKYNFEGWAGSVNARIGTNFIWALTVLDPETESIFKDVEADLDSLPTKGKKGFFGAELSNQAKEHPLSDSDRLKAWQIVYDALKKKYPNPPAIPPAPQSKVGIELAPMPKQAVATPRPDLWTKASSASSKLDRGIWE